MADERSGFEPEEAPAIDMGFLSLPEDVQQQVTEEAARVASERAADWTIDQETGRSNSSAEYHRLVAEVGRLIEGDKHILVQLHAERTAGLIMSHLAHRHGLRPVPADPDTVTVSREYLRTVLTLAARDPAAWSGAERTAYNATHDAAEEGQ